MVSCAVKSCRNTSTKRKTLNITFHRIPKNKIKREAWLKAINRDPLNLTYTTSVCSKHFTEDSFDRSLHYSKAVYLKEGAIPTLYLDNDDFVRSAETCSNLNISIPFTSEDKQPVGSVENKSQIAVSSQKLQFELERLRHLYKESRKKIKVLQQSKRRMIKRVELLKNIIKKLSKNKRNKPLPDE